jgi:hypothetical protein
MFDINDSANIDSPQCAVCLNKIDMSKELDGWKCSNNHSTVVCNRCFSEYLSLNARPFAWQFPTHCRFAIYVKDWD